MDGDRVLECDLGLDLEASVQAMRRIFEIILASLGLVAAKARLRSLKRRGYLDLRAR